MIFWLKTDIRTQNIKIEDIRRIKQRTQTFEELNTSQISNQNISFKNEEYTMDPYVEASTLSRIDENLEPQQSSMIKMEDNRSGHIYRTSQIEPVSKSNGKIKYLSIDKHRKKFASHEKSTS